MEEKELDELARSFHFDECVQRQGLNAVLGSHAGVRRGAQMVAINGTAR